MPVDPFERVYAQVRADLADMMLKVAAAAANGVADELARLAHALSSGGLESEMAKVHQAVSENAMAAVRNSFAQTVTGGSSFRAWPPGPSGYRSGDAGKNKRYSGGVLRNALQNPNLVTSTAREINFIDTSSLDEVARQWARLNFGAGTAGRKSPRRQFSIEFGGLVLGAIGLDQPARPDFPIPAGYWTGDNAFYPSSRSTPPPGGYENTHRTPRRITGGIKARNFFDAGLSRIAHDLPDGYAKMIETKLQREVNGQRPPPIVVRVRTHHYVL